MESYSIIGILFTVQVMSYLQLDRRNRSSWKYLVLIILLGLHLFAVPQLLLTIINDPNDGLRCGMSDLGLVLLFWVFGAGGTIIIHLAYVLWRRLKSKKQINTTR
ncbi:hypothetical protein FXV77_03755 [Sphingobacterium phlebotomi]|uniref:Uncharacterized protein n=1 Tax=Sphingobacterium phlebotomi TaxID=2605433 RepID=A0A5D4HCV7_9SPHI|nr:hypothetical protein [Sphingobacterium phlebotomi]TYR38404.1 hypothetical protein FXV77_03755 [Sphingobacterium phlebotomi]